MIAIRPPRLWLVLLLALLALGPTMLAPRAAAAAGLTFTVTSTADAPDAHPGDGVCADTGGQCTLRAAVQEADAQPSGSAITITVPAGTYGLPLGTLALTANRITIGGALSNTTILSGTDAGSVLAISPTVQASIGGVTLTGGNAGSGNGGGLLNEGQTILAQSTLISNTAGYGGGIYNAAGGRLTVVGSTLSANTDIGNNFGLGSGIANYGTLNVLDSTFSGNVTYGTGGGIYNFGTLTVTNSAFSGNTASNGGGGGIYNAGTLSVRHSTFSGNSALYGGGGINNDLSATASVTNSTFSDNTAPIGEGGGIYNFGTLSVSHSTISANPDEGIYNDNRLSVTDSTLSANSGGGIVNYLGSTLSVSHSTLSANSGAGIVNYGKLTVTNSTLISNTASFGGGIDNIGEHFDNNGTLSVTNSTLSANTASISGGGIANFGGRLSVTNSTLSANMAPTGGGIYNVGVNPFRLAATALSYVTVTGNSSGIDNDTSSGGPTTIALTGTIVANSTAGPNCSGPISESQGYNLDSSTSCGFSQTTDLTNTNPLLGPLADNGGPTQTMALLSGSPAIDKGGTHANGCPATDQRGRPRPDEAADAGACDMGAYE